MQQRFFVSKYAELLFDVNLRNGYIGDVTVVIDVILQFISELFPNANDNN
jgi:hypothetical protein